MSARHTRRWFTAIPITGRFYIMFAILLVSLAGIVFGALRAVHAQSEASADLARVAAVQRALDRALDLQATITAQLQAPSAGSAPGSQNLVGALRAQIEALWTLPSTLEVAAITDSLRQPVTLYLQGIDNYLRDDTAGNNASAWVFADLEPRRAALENALRDSMTRMQAVLQRMESRVLAEADGASLVNTWMVVGGLLVAVMAALMLWAIARSIQQSIHEVGEVAQALAAGDMDNRCEPHGSDEVSALARMINLLADTMQGMLTRLRSEANRSSFSNQLVEALEMADSEAEADRVIARAMGTISDVHPMELLLADSSRAHLERACVHPRTGSPNCSVDSPYSCIAVRRGYPQIFPDAEALNACPKLLGRMGGAMSAACVPVNFMGRALGVLHVAGAKGKPPNPEQIAQLTALGVHAGNRIGTLRAFERSQLQASTDSLTGLTNRRVGEEVLASLMTVDTAFAVVMADLDFFKRLNDTMGHDAGDRALKLFADTARSVVRDRDHVIRWGGE